MAQLKVGLAPNRTSYYDKITNTYITLKAPVQSISYDEADVPGTVARLEKIVHALFASVPALVLYEGNVPQESIDAWKAKYMKPFNTNMSKLVRDLNGEMVAPAVRANRAFDRPERVNAESVDLVVGANLGEAEIVSEDELLKVASLVPEKEEEVKELLPEKEEVEVMELLPEEEVVETKKTAATAKKTGNKTDK